MPHYIEQVKLRTLVLAAAIFIGADGRTRTVDLRITNALLYQLSYSGDAPDGRSRDSRNTKQKL